MSVETKTFAEVEELVGPNTRWSEAAVFMGAGGDIQQWVDGITGELEGIMTPGDEWFLITTTGGRKDLVMPLPSEGVDLGRMAVWKVGFGDCSWWSDYRVNYAKQHGEHVTVPDDEDDDFPDDDTYRELGGES